MNTKKGVLFSFGKFTRILDAGWHVVLPIFQSFQKVDVRTRAVDVPEQEAITKDNVSIRINAVLYYKIFDASKSVLAVKDFLVCSESTSTDYDAKCRRCRYTR